VAHLAADRFDILDCHHHYGDLTDPLGPLPTAAPWSGASAEPYERVELETRLRAMDAQGVRQALILPGHGYLRPRGLADTRRVNDDVAAYRDRLPERFPAAVGVVEPLYGEAGLAEIARGRAELGLVGFSFHVRFQGVSLDSPWVRRYTARMLELGLVPFIHAIADSPENALWKVEALAAQFPGAPMIVLDAFSSFEQAREVLPLAERQPQLRFDTSLAYTFGLIEPLIRALGPERVVFGTDLYSLVPRGGHVLEQILASDLDDAAKAAVLGGNLRGLLGLKPAPREPR
jgi:predicted TIM-barrel fold metal-dependent hydrolase